MLIFNPACPFPLIEPGSASLLETQVHAEEVDKWIGLRIPEVEAALQKKGCHHHAAGTGEKQELWIGLASRSLLTPYTEIRWVLNRLAPAPGSLVIDLGAAYGRMAFVISRHFPQVRFIGYEYVGERVEEGRRCLKNLKNPLARLEHVDLADPHFSPEPADIYFIYDFGTYKAVEKTLHDLRRVAQTRPIAVVGRGRLCRDLIERRHPWLSGVVPPEHHGNNSIYRSG